MIEFISLLLAFAIVALCRTPTSWVEWNDDGYALAVCGDTDGTPIELVWNADL